MKGNCNIRFIVWLMSLIVLLLFPCFSIHAVVLHVDSTSGNDSNNGLSWEEAVKSIGTAIAKAQAGDEIWVADGIYQESIFIKSFVSVHCHPIESPPPVCST